MSTSPMAVECSVPPLDVAFHPSRSTLLAAALMNGTVECHDFAEVVDATLDPSTKKNKHADAESDDDDNDDDEIDTILSSTAAHTQLVPSKVDDSTTKPASARCLVFSSDGANLYSGGSNGDFVALNVERISSLSVTSNQKNSDSAVLWSVPEASFKSSPLQVIKQLPDPHLVATGDEEGAVRIWDVRLLSNASDNNAQATSSKSLPRGCVHGWKEHEDYVSGLDFSYDGNTLLASSADCTLSVYDIRQPRTLVNSNPERFLRRSDDQEDELLSIKIIKNGKKVICGTGQGVLFVWSFGTWGDVSDRFPGHPASVDALFKVDEDTLLTGSSDGLIRVVSIHPDRLLGVLGEHGGYPVERLAMNADQSFVGSVSHDSIIRVWDARILHDGSDDDEEEDVTDSKQSPEDVVAAQVANATAAPKGSDDEWADMDGGSASDHSDESDSGNDNKRHSTNAKRAKRLKTENEKFFEDL